MTNNTNGDNGAAAGLRAQVDQLKRIVANTLLQARAQTAALLGKTFDGARDLYKVLGYKKILTFEDYFAVYDRGELGARLVDMPAESTWRHVPIIRDGDENGSEDTAFVKELKALADRLKLWHYLERLDRASGIGAYGVLLLGFRDGKVAESVKAGQYKGAADLAYLAIYDEGHASVEKLVGEEAGEEGDPRYGQPKTYKLKRGENPQSRRALPDLMVHWSRVIHVAEDLLTDEVFGRPRLKNSFNRLSDLEKVTGGSSEAAWKLAYKGLTATFKDGYGMPELEEDRQALEDDLVDFVHGFRRHIIGEGLEFKQEGGEVVDPTGMFNILVRLISGKIPWQMLIGAERGDVANKQDQETWAGEVASRQTKHAEPNILRALIDRLIWAGVLPKPDAGNYTIEWPVLYPPKPNEQAELDNRRADTLNKAIDAAAAGYISFEEVRRFGGLPDEMEGEPVDVLKEEDKQNNQNDGANLDGGSDNGDPSDGGGGQ